VEGSFELHQIPNGLLQQLNAILELPQSGVAVEAEQAPDFLRFVVMIHMEVSAQPPTTKGTSIPLLLPQSL
jgi:hypothetical protein